MVWELHNGTQGSLLAPSTAGPSSGEKDNDRGNRSVLVAAAPLRGPQSDQHTGCIQNPTQQVLGHFTANHHHCTSTGATSTSCWELAPFVSKPTCLWTLDTFPTSNYKRCIKQALNDAANTFKCSTLRGLVIVWPKLQRVSNVVS